MKCLCLPREDVYREEVISTLNYLKIRKIKRMIEQNQQDMQQPHTSDEQMMLIQTHQHLKANGKGLTAAVRGRDCKIKRYCQCWCAACSATSQTTASHFSFSRSVSSVTCWIFLCSNWCFKSFFIFFSSSMLVLSCQHKVCSKCVFCSADGPNVHVVKILYTGRLQGGCFYFIQFDICRHAIQ